MKLIAGLGNPGTKYQGTRHNVGFDVVDELARRHAIDMRQEKFHAWFGKGRIGEHEVAMLKPTTFMNRSGQAMAAVTKFYQLELADLCVVLDDMALPLGKLRARASGSSGGHNGLGDVIQRLGTEQVFRIRIGIEAPLGDAVNYVTSVFAPQERIQMESAVRRAADAVECWLSDGADTVMNRFNPDPKES